MKGWLIFHHELDPALPEVPEVLRFQETAERLSIGLQVLNPKHFDLVVGTPESWRVHYRDALLERPDFIICRTGAETDYFTLAVLRHCERRGVRIVNGPEAIEAVADKLRTMQWLVRAGLPIPRTILGKATLDATLVERELGFPVIVKTLKGTRGAGVFKCDDRDQFEDLTQLLVSAGSQSDILFQQYVRASHGRDVRVVVVGGKVVAAMERRSQNGNFKSNISLGGVGQAYRAPPDMARLAVRAAEALDLEVAGIDILFDDQGYRICEANSAPGFQGLEQACDIDLPKVIFDWIETQVRPRFVPSKPGEAATLRGLVRASRAHLAEVGESYPEHRRFAAAIGWKMVGGGLAALAHSCVPAIFPTTGSRTIASLNEALEDRALLRAPQPDADMRGGFVALFILSLLAALLPWLAGAPAVVAGPLSLLSLSFPVAYRLGERRDARQRMPNPALAPG